MTFFDAGPCVMCGDAISTETVVEHLRTKHPEMYARVRAQVDEIGEHEVVIERPDGLVVTIPPWPDLN